MAKTHGLGRGLGALIRDATAAPGAPGEKKDEAAIRRVPIGRVRKSPWQPRHTFEQEALADLTASIRQRGVLQPLLVRAVGEEFELIAGERRLRAATEAGLADVPVIVMEAADRDSLELALTENLQRADLNVLEEATGYQVLAERFSLTQEQIAERVGKARATVANTLRLLSLPADVRQLVGDGQLSAGHAKALTGLDIPPEQSLLARRAVEEGLSVRQLEKLIQKAKLAPRRPRVSRSDLPGAHLTDLTDRLHAHFGTSVRILPSRTYANGKKGKGCVEIDFYSNEELDRILSVLGIDAE
jgi:ParB family transcriptional regulator, chromosome partitioning protein